jgi:hypothetical protein
MNYFFAITTLIHFKDRHHLILTKKNEIVLKYLNSIDLPDDYDGEEVPDVTEISKATNLPRTKIHPILYESYQAMILSLSNTPHAISKCVQAIYVGIPYDEEERRNKAAKELEEKKVLWAELKLPVIPRLGETINLNFVDWNTDFKYHHGVVVDIHHDISVTQQKVIIYVHPYKNYYGQWEKLKQQHLNHERWVRELQSRKD